MYRFSFSLQESQNVNFSCDFKRKSVIAYENKLVVYDLQRSKFSAEISTDSSVLGQPKSKSLSQKRSLGLSVCLSNFLVRQIT